MYNGLMNTEILLDETKDHAARLTGFGKALPPAGPRRAALRVFMCMAQGMKCHYCQKKMSLAVGPAKGKHPDDLATFEHLVDEWSSLTGKNDLIENIVMACYRCNADRNRYRQNEVARFYTSKFPSKELYKHFATKAKPTDFIAMFGICPDTWKPAG